MLGFEAHGHSVTRANGDDCRVAETFAKLLPLTDDEVMRILTFVMAETLESGTCVVEPVGCHLRVDMTGSHAPDDAFFGLVRSKPAVNAMLAEIGGKTVADANLRATTKVQKGIIRDLLKHPAENLDRWDSLEV